MSIVPGKPLQDLQTKKFYIQVFYPSQTQIALYINYNSQINISILFSWQKYWSSLACALLRFFPFILHGSLQSWWFCIRLLPGLTLFAFFKWTKINYVLSYVTVQDHRCFEW